MHMIARLSHDRWQVRRVRYIQSEELYINSVARMGIVQTLS